MIDLIFDKVSSGEYAVTYLNGPITIFRGRITGYSANQNSTNDLLSIKLEITRGQKTTQKAPEVPVVPKSTGVVPLG